MRNLLIFVIASVLLQQAIAQETVCPLHEVYTDCGSACPITCDNYKNRDEIVCTKQCAEAGCYCEKDYVRNNDGTCCLPEECPKEPEDSESSCKEGYVRDSDGTCCLPDECNKPPGIIS